jgi:hypothetical protein
MARPKKTNPELTSADKKEIKRIEAEEPSIIIRAEKIRKYLNSK